ncbi:MAG: hypothetical protein ACP5IE_02215 [Infirmifilum sp.]
MTSPSKIGDALRIKSDKISICEVFGKHIYETTVGKKVYAQMPRLYFVVGYYGYGKTFGVGAYIICKLREQGKKYIYIDINELVNTVGKPDLQLLSLRDVIYYLHYVFNESGVPHERLHKEYKIDTNIENLPNRLELLTKIDYENSNIVKIFDELFGEVSKEPLYIIIDQLEGVTTDLRRSIEETCTEIRQLHDAGKYVYLLLLMQRAKVVKELRTSAPECPKDHPARGISNTYKLTGYKTEDYQKILRNLYDSDEDVDKKLLEKLEILPPRIVFELINRSTDLSQLKENLESLLSDTREELYLKVPKNKELSIIVQNFLKSLKLGSYKKIPSKINKLYIFKVKCNSKSITLCIDFRSRKTKSGEADCDIELANEGGILRLGSGEELVETGHFLATFSNRETILKGLEDLYSEIKEMVVSRVSSEVRSRCGAR